VKQLQHKFGLNSKGNWQATNGCPNPPKLSGEYLLAEYFSRTAMDENYALVQYFPA
jgi:hypothetical protein